MRPTLKRTVATAFRWSHLLYWTIKLWTEVRVGVEEVAEWYLRIPFPRKENTGKSSELLASIN